MAAPRRGIGEAAGARAFGRRTASTTQQAGSAGRVGIVAALHQAEQAPGDAEGGPQLIDAVLAEVAPHPDNPRRELGDLAELTASLREFGLLQPLVVTPREAFAAAYPQHPVDERARWVVVAGHRRRAAALEAGMSTVPVVVRPDLAEPAAAGIAFIAENVHRRELSPMEEAQAFSTLADLGLSQRAIAQRCAVSQSHVSKRLGLLALPQPAQDALATGDLPIGDALTLVAADEDVRGAAWDLYSTNNGWRMEHAVADVVRAAEGVRNRQAAEEEIRAAGLELIDPQERWGSQAWDRRLYREADIEAARSAGTLVAAATTGGVVYFTTAKPSKESTTEDTGAREAARARAAREVACGELVRKLPAAAVTTQDLVAAMVVHGGGGFAAALKLARKWLRGVLGPAEESDPYTWHRAVTAGTDRERLHLAWAMAIAQDELVARAAYRRWGMGDVAHVRRLMDRVGYEPTMWELDRIAEAERRGAQGEDEQDEAEESL